MGRTSISSCTEHRSLDRSQAIKVTGLISSATWGQGRSSADRQFYYINGRPVDLPVVVKAVNEVYKSFNTNQLPVVVLDFSVPRGLSFSEIRETGR